MIKKELFFFSFTLTRGEGHLVAGVEGPEDTERAPALPVPVGVGHAGGVALLEVDNLALLAADPRVFP